MTQNALERLVVAGQPRCWMADGSQILEGWKAAKDTAPKEAWNGMCFAADHRQMILEGSSV